MTPDSEGQPVPESTDEHRIRLLAYAIWRYRDENGKDGTAESDWLVAEKRLKA
jgi:hypothetical protein